MNIIFVLKTLESPMSTSKFSALVSKYFPKVFYLVVDKIWQKMKTYSLRWLFY